MSWIDDRKAVLERTRAAAAVLVSAHRCGMRERVRASMALPHCGWTGTTVKRRLPRPGETARDVPSCPVRACDVIDYVTIEGARASAGAQPIGNHARRGGLFEHVDGATVVLVPIGKTLGGAARDHYVTQYIVVDYAEW